jgi:predicted anti-sigma-YlaC factor YlaD
MKTLTQSFLAVTSSLFMATSLLLAEPALAADGEGFTIKVGHDYDVKVKTGAVTSVALGNDAHADINVGGIQVQKTNVEIGHDYKVDVQSGAVTAVALGKNVSARINLGGIQSFQ